LDTTDVEYMCELPSIERNRIALFLGLMNFPANGAIVGRARSAVKPESLIVTATQGVGDSVGVEPDTSRINAPLRLPCLGGESEP
jgi:hypothetical protein